MAIIVEIGKSHPLTMSSASLSVVLPIRAQLHIFLLSKAMKVVRNRCPFVFPSPESDSCRIYPIPVIRFNPTDEKRPQTVPNCEHDIPSVHLNSD